VSAKKGQNTHHSSWRVETVQNLEEKKAGQSSGQTEGQINRHKTLKRALFGRANTVLLRPRFLPIGEVRSPSLRMTLIYGNVTVVHPAASVTSVCARNAVPVFLVGQRNFGPSPSDCPADRPGRSAPWDLGVAFIDLHRTTLIGGVLLEAIGTFFLANTVLNAALRRNGWATCTVCDRHDGDGLHSCLRLHYRRQRECSTYVRPCIAAGDFSEVGIYISAQLIGAACAGLLYRFVWNRANVKQSASNTIAVAVAS